MASHPPPLLPLLFVLAFLAIVTMLVVDASPPAPVVTCTSPGNTNCTVTNYCGTFPDRSTCHVAAAAYPSTESELLAVVSAAAAKKQHMKVATAHGHSIPKLSCPGGPAGSGLIISTLNLSKVVSIDPLTSRVTSQPGITLRELIDAAAAAGIAMSPAPYWQGVTLGGLLGTGAHGSSMFGKGSAVHEYVVGMRVVMPLSAPDTATGLYAKVVVLGEGDKDLLAAKVSLGVLGVVSQITLQLQPMFKRSITYKFQKDTGFESTITSYAHSMEFGDITWYPAMGRVIFRDDFRLPITTTGKGINDFITFRSQPSLAVASTRVIEETQEALEDVNGKCLMAKNQVMTMLQSGQGLKNNDGSLMDFHGYPVIGNQSDMQTSGSCLNSSEDDLMFACGWDPRIHGLFFHQTTVSIPIATVASFISDVKKLRDANPNSLCGVDFYAGILMRFIRNSTAYLGKTADSVDIDIIYYRSRDPSIPRLFEDVLEEVEQMALFKYGGLPHLGKNRNVGFLGLRCKLGTKGDKFVKAMRRFDPDGLFSSDWTDAVLGLRGKSLVVDAPGCALEGLCICSTDAHCAPSMGYRCMPGVVYKAARVCRKTSSTKGGDGGGSESGLPPFDYDAYGSFGC